jgi:hypothetical protein
MSSVTKQDLMLEEADLVSEVEKMTAGKIQVRESWREAEKRVHAAAFEHYYSLGDERTLMKVAKYMKVTEQTVQKWSSKFHWQERIRVREVQARDRTNVHTKLQIDEVKQAVADYLGEELRATVEYDKNGKIKVHGPKIKNLKDVEKAIDVYYRITGELAKEEQARAMKDTGNGVNIQFVIKGR